MYFRNYGLRKMWVNNCLKSGLRGPFDPLVNRPNTAEIETKSPSSYLLMTAKPIDLE